MTFMTRRTALAKLAESHEVHPSDQNSGAEALARYLDWPETIGRWIAVTRSTETGVKHLVADFATCSGAKQRGEANIESRLFEELPVEVVDLDAGTTVACHLEAIWWEEAKPERRSAHGAAE